MPNKYIWRSNRSKKKNYANSLVNDSELVILKNPDGKIALKDNDSQGTFKRPLREKQIETASDYYDR